MITVYDKFTRNTKTASTREAFEAILANVLDEAQINYLRAYIALHDIRPLTATLCYNFAIVYFNDGSLVKYTYPARRHAA